MPILILLVHNDLVSTASSAQAKILAQQAYDWNGKEKAETDQPTKVLSFYKRKGRKNGSGKVPLEGPGGGTWSTERKAVPGPEAGTGDKHKQL